MQSPSYERVRGFLIYRLLSLLKRAVKSKRACEGVSLRKGFACFAGPPLGPLSREARKQSRLPDMMQTADHNLWAFFEAPAEKRIPSRLQDLFNIQIALQILLCVWIPILQNAIDRVHSNTARLPELQPAIPLYRVPMGYLTPDAHSR